MMISNELLEDAAFELLVSSSPERYVRVAGEMSRHVRLKERVDSGEIPRDVLRRWVVDRWRLLLTARQRGREEIELAVVLPGLAQRTEGWVHALLNAMAASSTPSTTWISGLARSLLRTRAANTIVTNVVSNVRSTSHSGAAVERDRLWPFAQQHHVTSMNQQAA